MPGGLPDGAILRTEFDTVVIQSDVCIAACPFGVIDINPVSGTAQKCTLCYDRMQVGLEPACAKACPTDSIQFGPIAELKTRAGPCRAAPRPGRGTRPPLRRPRHDAGRAELVLLLVDRPEVYGLPPDPKLPSRNLARSSWFSVLGGVLIGLAGLVSFRTRGRS